LSNDYDNWCPEIYRSVFIDRHNDGFIKVAPCCQAIPAMESADKFDFATSSYLSGLRQKFSRGERPTACNRCWEVEAHGHKSRRHSAIEFFQLPAPDTTIQLESLDHSATWACNLACIMCDPYFSSTWAAQQDLDRNDLQQLGRLFQKNNRILGNLDLRHIKKIHFNGGEPMLNNDQTDLLLRLEQQGVLQNALISYNTNATVMPSDQIIDLWSRAGLVKIFFSIDAIGAAFEYIRWPGKWKQVTDNIHAMKTNLPNNVMFGFNTTIGNYNLLEIADLYQWFEQNLSHNREGDASDFCWQFSRGFDMRELPVDAKHAAMEQLQKIPALNGVVSYVRSTLQHREDLTWTNKLQTLDAKRNTDWKSALSVSKFIKETTC
jgi:hypothetical protein